MNKMDELVFAVERSKLEPLFNGYKDIGNVDHSEFFRVIYDNYLVLSRRDCEDDPKFKHIIPYTMVTSEDNEIFVVRRTEKQSEQRLHGKSSIGIGGHVGPTNKLLTVKEEIQTGMLRELKEELTGMDLVGERFDFTPYLMGVVNDDSNNVGSVHLGFVYELLVNPDRKPSIQVKETENMVGEWMPLEEAKKVPNYESWSQLIMTSL